MTKSPDQQDSSDKTSIAQEIKSLIPALQQFIDQQAEGQVYRLPAEALADELASVADRGGGYPEARQALQSHQFIAALWGATLGEMLTNLDHFEQARLRREIYSPRWWEQTVQTLQQAFDQDPQAAYQQWVNIYTQALVDWDLKTCNQLVSTSFPYPRDQYPYALLIRHGNAALQEKDYPATLEMLNYLVTQLAGASIEDLRLLGALLSIFIGRIHLYNMKAPELARTAFDRAVDLAPRDGRPLAALGHIALQQGGDALAEANRLFSRAIEFSPDQPDGHVGKAMIAEKRELWAEADEWYTTAVQETLDERDVLQFLSKMLAPGSSRLYLQAARRFLADGILDHALEAIEICLQLGMHDGSSYPSRSALALKADILSAISGQELTTEQAKKIADLYFEAGQYYTWNDEYQAGINLFKKARELDSSNALVLFYLADDLRVLSHISTPPYTDERLARESLAAWEAGMQIQGTSVGADIAWIYIARARIDKQLAYLPGENYQERYWQAIQFNERGLLLNEYTDWWAHLSNSFNELELYANMLHVLQKVLKAHPKDIFSLGERAKVLINTGQYPQAITTLNKLLQNPQIEAKDKLVYQSWQTVVDYYQGNYSKALEDIEPCLQQQPDNLWMISLRANVYRAMGNDQAAMQDELWIWERREDPNYQTRQSDYAWSAYRQGKFQESIRRIEPFLSSIATGERNNAQLLTGLDYLALGNFDLAQGFLSLALQTCTNPRFLADLSLELDLIQRCASQEKWLLNTAIISYLHKPDGILKLVQSKQKKMKSFKVDPVKEFEAVLSNPATGTPGSSSWLAAQLGLGRLHLEAGHLDSAEQAYQALAQSPQPIPEAQVGLEKARVQVAHT
jgi:Tfp pilus assembly protein PilF